MSTAAAWDSTTAAWDTAPRAWGTAPQGWGDLPSGASPRRSRLVVLDGGAVRRGHDSARTARVRPGVLAIPRWARLALTLSVAAVLASILLGVGGAGATTGSLGSVEVRPGQTLSEIARAEMPGVPTAEAVARIQLANNLPSSHVTAGQALVIPSY